jgi:hypothetical protein
MHSNCDMLFCCGYKRTGKTTFCSNLAQYRFEYDWQIYCAHEDVGKTKHRLLSFVDSDTGAFADAIKSRVRFDLGYLGDFEKDKDTLFIGGKLLRQHLIDTGATGRAWNQGYWVNQLLLAHANAKRLIVSDFRFKNEYYYAPATPFTVRLFRSDVPVPAPDIGSEHDLDQFRTNAVLVPSERDFEQCCDYFPMYSSYEHCGNLAAEPKKCN